MAGCADDVLHGGHAGREEQTVRQVQLQPSAREREKERGHLGANSLIKRARRRKKEKFHRRQRFNCGLSKKRLLNFLHSFSAASATKGRDAAKVTKCNDLRTKYSPHEEEEEEKSAWFKQARHIGFTRLSRSPKSIPHHQSFTTAVPPSGIAPAPFCQSELHAATL